MLKSVLRPPMRCCPFCGCEEIKPVQVLRDYRYECVDCTTMGPNGMDDESAALQWNTRVDASALRVPKPVKPSKAKKQLRPCLGCDKPYMTTLLQRLCKKCVKRSNALESIKNWNP